jgi:hypothetical protein
MELARVVAGSGIDFDATLVFALWTGEEHAKTDSAAQATTSRSRRRDSRRSCSGNQRRTLRASMEVEIRPTEWTSNTWPGTLT